MSRRLRFRAAAIDAKRAFAWTTPVVHDCGPEDDDDEGGIDVELELDPCPCFPGCCRGGQVIDGRLANGQRCKAHAKGADHDD